jgi:hypothetical protein
LVFTPSTVKLFSAPLAPFTWKPPSMSPKLTPGDVSAIPWNERVFGMRSNSSAVTLWATVVLCRSTCVFVSLVTVTTSLTPPTFNDAGKSAVLPSSTSTSSA